MASEPQANEQTLKKSFSSRINPIIRNVVANGAKGYVFGTLVGLLNSRKSIKCTLSDMHSSGKRFMMLGMIYTGSEALIETVRGKRDPLNVLGASAIAGGLVMSRNGLGKSVLGAVGFSVYTGLNEFYYTRDDK
ncbi:putative Mitochondrial inner membrane translocase complex, subunit Tim17/22 protein [Trachipleistophora hominis]|uniref:Mitochondrial import inner membrane translocase subunit TIM22 n=1 Tax=Trachipleistophora hominis TaxID=72359 RepID=L7JU14_TRAHO|nr:putative Mitochondrial inner membrane translocase complex, subunit Tim17/22 protein [Trachipleistophora hominis]